MSKEVFPKKYKHKETGKVVTVSPWWEISDPILTEADIQNVEENRMIKIGALVQVGWLLSNDNDVYFGVGMAAIDYFEEIENNE